jgi:hypothetical protein
MTRFLQWISKPFVIASLMLFFGVLDLILLGHQLDLSKSDWSGWVQAVGSIGAIIASGWIANWQYTRHAADQEAQRKRAELVPMLAILTLVRDFEFHSFLAISSVTNAVELDVLAALTDPLTLFDAVETSLKAIPLHQLPSPEAVRDMASLLAFIPFARTRITAALKEFETEQWDPLEAGIRMDSIQASARLHVTAFEMHVKSLGGDPDTGTHFGR